LCGQASEAVLRHKHDQLKTFGAGRERSRQAWIATVRQLFAAGALAEANEEHGGFAVTEKGKEVLFGREPISLRVVPERPAEARRDRSAHRAARLDGLEENAAALFEHLRALRSKLAKAEGIAAFMVFADRTLIDMAQLRPRNLSEMRMVHGVGERKLASYGEAFLDAIAEAPT
jgi:ATP-dependent DNA helicase RecQ